MLLDFSHPSKIELITAPKEKNEALKHLILLLCFCKLQHHRDMFHQLKFVAVDHNVCLQKYTHLPTKIKYSR